MIPWEFEGFWRFDGSMDCDDPSVIGGIGPNGSWPSHRAVTVEVPAAGTYFLYSNNARDVWLRMGPCFGCPWEDPGILLEGQLGKTVELEAGKYYVRIGSESHLSPEVTVRLEKW